MLTSKYMNINWCFDRIDRLADVCSWIFARGFLNEEMTSGALSFLGDDADATSRRIVVDLLKKGILISFFMKTFVQRGPP
jgi:hypothetical protein